MKYLKHLLLFDQKHLRLMKEMIFDRMTWDEEIDEDKPLLQRIETLISERKAEGVSRSSWKDAQDITELVDSITVKILDGSFTKDDIPEFDYKSVARNGWNVSKGTFGLLVGEQLAQIIATTTATSIEQKTADKVFTTIVRSLESAKAPTSWIVFMIRNVSMNHGISMLKFQGSPEFSKLAVKYRHDLRRTV